MKVGQILNFIYIFYSIFYYYLSTIICIHTHIPLWIEMCPPKIHYTIAPIPNMMISVDGAFGRELG